ncbi:MAG: site-2 protease family protein, partial [Elusimicrobiota bacterium]
MKRFRSAIALTLSLALILLSPGSSSYHAVAQTMGAAVNGTSSVGVAGSVGANLGRPTGVNAIPVLGASSLNLSPVLSAPSITPTALLNAAVIPAAAVAAPIVVNAAQVPAALSVITPAAAKAQINAATAKAVVPAQSAIAALKTNVSAPSVAEKPAEVQAAQSRQQFDGAALKSELSAPAVSGESDIRSNRAALTAAKKDSGKGMPDQGVDDNGNPTKDGGIDELGNPRRTGGEGGPDDRSDPDQSDRGGNSGLFGMFGVGLLGGAAATVAGLSFGSIAMFPMIILSLVLHEIGHARMADKLGDPTARLQNRASFNPRHWMTHIDPIWTLLVPAVTFLTMGMIFGGARPVPVETRYFKNPVKDMALVALAGPAVNMGLAVAGALAITGALAAGLGAGVVAMLGMFVFLNVLLAVFNLIPLPPLDGSHMLKAFLPYQARAAMDNFMEKLGPMGVLLPMLVIFYVAGGAIAGASMFIAKLLIGGVMSVTGVQMASAFLPAVAALGLAVGQIGAGLSGQRAAAEAAPAGPSAPNNGAASGNSGNGPVDLIVMFGEKTNFVVKPTDNIDDVQAGIENLPIDSSGIENVFTAIKQSVNLWSSYRTEQHRRIMLITITDEAGDDFGKPQLDAIAVCRRYGARAYVIGPTAPFGKRRGFLPYVAPENGKTYQLPIDLGPEAALAENVNLPFWF